MGDFDNIKDKLLNYQSPIDTEKEWQELTLKQENATLKKELRTRNVIGAALGIGLFVLGGVWIMMSINTNLDKNTLSNTHSNNPTTTRTEITDGETPNSKQTINFDETLTKEQSMNSDEMQTLEEVSDADEMLTLKKTSIPTKTKTNSKPKKQISDVNTNIHSTKKTTFDIPTDVNDSEKQKIKPKKVQENTKLSFKNTQPTKNVSQKTHPAVSIATTKSTPLIQTNKQYTTAVTPQTLATKYPLIDRQINTNLIRTADPVPPKYKLQRGRRNFVGLELLGQGGFYSLNYGRVLSRQRFGETDIQAGLTLNPLYIGGNPTNIHLFMGTLSVNQSFRIYKPHYLTLGLTTVFGSNTSYIDNLPDSYYNIVVVVPKVGYRYQASESRIFYKAELIFYRENLYPSYSDTNTETTIPSLYPSKIPVWGGVGIGYKF